MYNNNNYYYNSLCNYVKQPTPSKNHIWGGRYPLCPPLNQPMYKTDV